MSLLTKLKSILAGKPPTCSAVIVAAGLSERIDGENKLFIEMCGAPVLAHTLVAFQNCDCITEIIIVAREDQLIYISKICEQYNISKAVKLMVGGPTRLESAMNGVLAVSRKMQLVAIHDGARPCIDAETIIQAVSAAAKYNAVAPGIPASSTFKKVEDGVVQETVDREHLIEIQTPQVFSKELIKSALSNAINKSILITDDCMAVEQLGHPVHITEGSRNNIKLTTNEDIVIAAAILDARKAAAKLIVES